ncbi:MAG: glycosyltransferase [Acidimicrobiia bacterium]|nr:glycosyltransferase [Acidimicrobiia bacterium]
MLLIDALPERSKALAWHLESRSIGVQRTNDGWIGLELIAESVPDLIVVGLELDRPDGVQLLEHLMARRDLSTVPIVAIGGVPGAVEPSRFGVRVLPEGARMADAAAIVLKELEEARWNGPDARMLDVQGFAHEIAREHARRSRGGSKGFVVSLTLFELPAVRLRLGHIAESKLLHAVAELLTHVVSPMDVIGITREDRIGILVRDTSENAIERKLRSLGRAISEAVHEINGERILFTPAIGYVALDHGGTPEEAARRAETARVHGAKHLDLRATRWDKSMEPDAIAKATPTKDKLSLLDRFRKRMRTPMQILLTFVIGLVVPFFAYWGSDSLGYDLADAMYLFVVVSLLITGMLILYEGHLAVRQAEPPEVAEADFPRASAVIAAYLPNEAATVLETIEAFLEIDYPNDLEIILAYNTPDPLPVEARLRELADRYPNFNPVEVRGSSSKAQNVNAVLSMATGAFTGVFDADHMPRPDAFRRAWRWLANGYDVVQGHCLTRNGDSTWLAGMIAVEFEGIYAVAHPGRARMHHFGIFGGSNGYWKTETLHEIRMRGSMLTEDIDSALRVIKKGRKIRSDRDLVSRELATTTLKQVWNQRLRWAQGWFQVSMEHARGMMSKELSARQRFGMFHLLLWRELYPWLSMQMIPIVAYSLWRGEFDPFIPVWMATTIITFSVGPIQTLYAYRLADPAIKQHKRWFIGYLFFSTFFYTEFKNLINRVSQVKEFMGEKDWRVTPRSADPVSED